MGTVTASLERSLQNCSLNQTQTQSTSRIRRRVAAASSASSSSSESSEIVNQQHLIPILPSPSPSLSLSPSPISNHSVASSSDDNGGDENSRVIQLNSHISLPYHWEQCLDLKTGELYYINWRTGKKMKEDPRTTATGYCGDYDSEEEEEEEEDEDDDESDNEDEDEDDESERSSTESSCWSSQLSQQSSQQSFRSAKNRSLLQQQQLREAAVLVVAGCKSCLMYHMVPKHVDQCPKCCGHLLHFPANNSSSS